VAKHIIIALQLTLEDGADPENVSEGVFDQTCNSPFDVPGIDTVDGYDWKPDPDYDED
jgi:hypothetical protein